MTGVRSFSASVFLWFVWVQLPGQTDSAYIRPFDYDFSARGYLTNKIVGFDTKPLNEKEGSVFRINAPVGVGFGASWKSYGFAFSRRISLLRDPHKVKTSSLEFQYYGYKRKFAYSVYFQQHRGFYDEQRNPDGNYTTYPDAEVYMYGGTFQWIFNNKRFSYKAAFNQNERQVRSAGSFLLGGALYHNRLNAGSMPLFSDMRQEYENIQFGLSGGYAYSWVLGRHWLLTGSADLGVNLGNNYPTRLFKKKLEVYPTIGSRIAVGYSVRAWSFGLASYSSTIYLFMHGNENLGMNEFNMQVNIIRRFDWGNKFVNNTLNQAKSKLDRFGL